MRSKDFETKSLGTVKILSHLIPVAACAIASIVSAQEPKWDARIDIGGIFPTDSKLTQLNGPVSGEEFKLDTGIALDMAVSYHVTPWLAVGPELGLTFNSVDSLGSLTYPDTSLFQMPLMATVTLQYPYKGRFQPFVGAGVGGVASFLTFGNNYYYDYYYNEPDGSGADFVFAFEAYGGLRYQVAHNWSIGVVYRYLQTDPQSWDVEFHNGCELQVAVNSLHFHSLCLIFTGTF
jgi:opacity protein-like surface antigen